MPSVRNQTICVSTSAGGNIVYNVRGTAKNSDDPKNSHLKKLEVGEEKLTLNGAEITEGKNLCFGHGVSLIESPVADKPCGRKLLSKAIVKVLRTGPPPPDFTRPHQREAEDYIHRSSGIILHGKIVLTCAHSVDHHSVVQLKKNNSNRLYTATVRSVALECDLAMLTVDGDEEFWEGVVPLEFGAVPAERDEVIIMGFLHSRNQVSSVRCEVTNVDMVTYVHLGTKLLSFQVSEEIKEGISGGVVCDLNGKCLGMPFQSSVTNGDVIPVAVIEHFLQDYDKHGAYTGIPILPITWQTMVNPELRKLMNMKEEQKGVRITKVTPNYPEYESLKPGDVIVSIDGTLIGNNGKVLFGRGLLIDFTYLVAQKFTGDNVVFKVIRNSKIKELNITLATHKQFKQANNNGTPLSYYMIAGFFFTTLSYPYLKSLERRKKSYEYSLEELESQSLYEESKYRREELLSQALYEERVVVYKVLKAEINFGYHDEKGIKHTQVSTFNGKHVQSLTSLVSMVESCHEKVLLFTLENEKMLVLDTQHARDATPGILKTRGIPSAMSDDLEKLIVAKPGGQYDPKCEREREQKLTEELNRELEKLH